MPTSLALSLYFETFIRAQVESGRYNNVSEVVRAGLRLPGDTERKQAIQLQALRNPGRRRRCISGARRDPPATSSNGSSR